MGSPSSTVSNKQVRFLPSRLVDKKLLEMQPEKSGILSAAASCCSPLDQSWSVMASRASPRPEQASPASTDSQCDVGADFSVLCPWKKFADKVVDERLQSRLRAYCSRKCRHRYQRICR